MSYKFTSEFQYNKYDQAKIAIQNKALFNENDWRTAIANGTIDAYIGAIQNSDKINPDEFYKKYNLYYGDPANKLSALYTEVGADRTTLRDYEMPLFDESGNYVYDESGKQLFETVKMTEYDYNKNMISTANKLYGDRSIVEAAEKSRIENRNFWTWVNDFVTSPTLQGGTSLLDAVEDIGGLVLAYTDFVGRPIDRAIKYPFIQDPYGGVEEDGKYYGDWFNYVFKDLESDETLAATIHKYTSNNLGDQLQKPLDEFNYKYTHYYDENGEMTTMGRWLTGSADTIGRMVPTILLSYFTAGFGASLMSTSALGTTAYGTGSFLATNAGAMSQMVYYGSNVFGGTVAEQYEYAASQGLSITSNQIVANALLKTALQMGVEQGLGEILGVSGIDKMRIGGKSTTNLTSKLSTKNMTLNGLLRFGKDALQEGGEEVLQETTDWLTDKAFHHFINHDFQDTEWNWQNIGDAFIIALLTSTGGAIVNVGGQTVKNVVKDKSIFMNTKIVKTDKDGNLVKNSNGEYEFVKLNPIAAYEYGLDMESYVDNMQSLRNAEHSLTETFKSMSEEELKNAFENKKFDKAMKQYMTAYYDALVSFRMLAGLYNEMGQERFNKANEILKKLKQYQDDGVFDEKLVKEAQNTLINSFESLNAESKNKMLRKVIEAEMTESENSIKRGETAETEDERKASELLDKLKNVNEVHIMKDGKMPLFYEGVLLLPKNLLKNGTDKVIMASLAEQELADELTEGVLTKTQHFSKEVGIVTDLYKQWSGDESVTEKEAIYNLIFNPTFFEITLALNERDISSFLLRLNKLTDIAVKENKDLSDQLLQKRISECRERWIKAAFNYYSNNLEKDASLFTSNLTKEEKRQFQEELNKLLSLYNSGKDIIINPKNVEEELWSFIDKRIDNIVSEEVNKDELKTKLRSSNAKERQSALDFINEYYEGRLNTLYNGKVYMPKNSVGNYAFNNFMQSRNLTLKTLFNSDYFTDEDLDTLGDNYTLDDVIALRQSQFEELFLNMSFTYENGNIVVNVDNEPDGFQLYKNIVGKNNEEILSGKSFKIGDKNVDERKFATTLTQLASWSKKYLSDKFVKDKVYEWITVDELISHPEYFNEATIQDILSSYKNLDRNNVFLYFQQELISDSNGDMSLVIKQNGDIVVANMSKSKSMIKKLSTLPSDGKHSIDEFVNRRYLRGSLANVIVEISHGVKTAYYDYEKDGDRYIFVNKIVINIDNYSDIESFEFALLHEFQHAIQFENRLNTGSSRNILSGFSNADKKSIIKTVKEMHPELFNSTMDEKRIEGIVNSYLYFSSGETQAMGISSIDGVVFYPTILSRKNGKTTVTFSNGKTFTTTGSSFNFIASVQNVTGKINETIDKFYKKYEVIKGSPMQVAQCYKYYKSVISTPKEKRTKDLSIAELYSLFTPDVKASEFIESNVVGIELDGIKYLVSDPTQIENLVIMAKRRYSEPNVSVKIFTVKPKDIKSFESFNSFSNKYGRVEVDKSYMSNVRNVLVDLTKVPETVSEQSLRNEVYSIFTGEVLESIESTKDIDLGFYNIYKKYSSNVDGSYSDMPMMLTQLQDLLQGTTIETGLYNYVSKSTTEVDGRNLFPETNNFTVEERQDLVNDIMGHPYYRHKMFNIWRENWGWKDGKVPSMNEFLEMELPIIRVHNARGDTLNESPFVSAAILGNDDISIYELTDWLQRETSEYINARMEAGEDFDTADGVSGNLFFGSVKIKDIITFVPAGLQEVLVNTNTLTKKGIRFSTSLDDYNNFTLGFNFNTNIEPSPQELSTDVGFEQDGISETKYYRVDKPKKAEGKVIDNRPKSERRRKFDTESKKYSKSTTSYGASKNATRVVTAKDIDKDVIDSGIQISAPRGGNYVYRKFIERRYYIKPDGSEGAKDIFEYYEVKDDSRRRHTLKSEVEDTNLKYFTTKKGKNHITMSPGLREFVIASTYVEIDPYLMNKIKKGTLTKDDLFHYVMDTPTDKMDNVTFRLILDKVYHNTNIKSAAHLDNLVNVDSKRMHALYQVLKDSEFEDFLYEELNDKKLDNIWNFVSQQSAYSEKLNKIFDILVSEYILSLDKWKDFNPKNVNNSKRYQSFDTLVKDKEMRYRFIRFYGGTIVDGSKASYNARKSAYLDSLPANNGYIASRFGEKSKYAVNAAVKQQEIKSYFNAYDDIEADTFSYDSGDALYELQDITDGIGKNVYETLARKSYEVSQGNLTFTKQAVDKYFENFANLSKEQQYNLYNQFLEGLSEDALSKLYYLAELPGFEDVIIESDYTREQGVKDQLNKIVNYGSKVQGIKKRLKTIQNRIKTPTEKRLLLEKNSDILDENLNLKIDAYREKSGYKSIEIIDEIAKRISQISEATKNNVYRDNTSYKQYIKNIDKKSKNFSKLIETVNKGSKNGIKFINVSTDDGSVTVKSKSEVPQAIRQILSVGLTHSGRSKIQELTKYHEKFNEDGSTDKVYDEKYLKLTMTDLLRKNAELLNDMSEDEATEILEFYVGDNILITDVDSEIVSETVRLVCAYLLGESRYSYERYGKGFERFNFDDTLIEKVELKMKEQSHMSAVMMSNQRTIIRLLQPNKIIAQELAKHLGFELDDVDEQNLDNMLTQMRIGTKQSYKEAKRKFEEKLIREYDDKNKQSVIDKLLTFQRAMMLSNPGTWARNIVSDVVLEKSNILSYKVGKWSSDLLLKLFPKTKGKIESFQQYEFGKSVKFNRSLEKYTENVNGKDKSKMQMVYTIKGGSISEDTKNFINEKFIKSGLLDDIASGISKYDLDSDAPVSDNLVDMAARAIHQNIRREQVFSTGPLNKLDKNGKFGKAHGKFLNAVLKTVYKGINDGPWVKRATIRYFAQILEQDYQQVKADFEKKGKTLTYEKYLSDVKNNVYGVTKYVESAFIKSVSLASYDYMKTGNFLTAIEKAIRMNVPKGAWFMYKQVFPFLSASWNWCVEGMRYTPAGLASAVYKLMKLENTINKMDSAHKKGKSIVNAEFAKYLQVRNIGKGIIGTITLTIGLIFYAMGWAGVDEEDDEYKLFIGDIKLDINDVLGTQGFMMGVVIASAITEEGFDPLDVISEVFNQLFRDSIFQDFIDTFRYDEGFGDFMWNTIMDIPLQFWPNFLKTLASIVHYRGVEYSENKLIEKLQRIFVKSLPLPEEWVGANTSVNPYTGKTESFFGGELFTEIFSKYTPVKVNYPAINNNEAISIGLGVKKGQLSGSYTIDGEKVNLTSKEILKLNTLYGKLNNETLTKFYNNSLEVEVRVDDGSYKILKYSKMNEKQKRAAVNNLMSNNSSYSKIYILTNTGKYRYYASKSEYEKLRKLGITKNVYIKTDKKSGFVKI